MESNRILISAEWDPQAGVYVAESHDVPGLITEAPSHEALLAKVQAMVPELLQLNGPHFEGAYKDFTIEILYRTQTTLRIYA